jgi:hypothetical protein
MTNHARVSTTPSMRSAAGNSLKIVIGFLRDAIDQESTSFFEIADVNIWTSRNGSTE